MQRKLITAGIVGLLMVSVADAEICDLAEVARPPGFPDQPLNIIIPRSTAAGARGLSAKIADAINNLKDRDDNDLNIEAKVLFKFGGNMKVAIEYYASLPPNGYNILQLPDSYASLRAQGDIADDLLTPLAITQITFSQIYIRSDDTRFANLEQFYKYADTNPPYTLKIANFGIESGKPGTENVKSGLEDFLLKKFVGDRKISIESFESGSERYMSLFNKRSGLNKRTDALIEQPGDIFKLLENQTQTLRPIFTLLPENKLPELPEILKAEDESFGEFGAEECQLFYRFRGFFVHAAMDEKRRKYLEWIFRKAFNSRNFQEYNEDLYIPVLDGDKDIYNSYCSSSDAIKLVEDMVEKYKQCFPPDTVEKLE